MLTYSYIYYPHFTSIQFFTLNLKNSNQTKSRGVIYTYI